MTLNGMKIKLREQKKNQKLIGTDGIRRTLDESTLHQVTNQYAQYIRSPINTRHRIALTKLRLSNHKLVIETGRYSRPFKKPAERICPICKIEMEDEYHFINICPGYWEKNMFVTRLLGKRIQNKNKQNVT